VGWAGSSGWRWWAREQGVRCEGGGGQESRGSGVRDVVVVVVVGGEPGMGMGVGGQVRA
jgi:hypothetical protein